MMFGRSIWATILCCKAVVLCPNASLLSLGAIAKDSFVAAIAKTLEEMKNLVVFASPIS